MVDEGHLGGGQALAHDGKLLFVRGVTHAAGLRLQPLLLRPCVCQLQPAHTLSASHAFDSRAESCCCQMIVPPF